MSSEKNPTRPRILEATLKLLQKGEASAVRMSDIAKAAKISRQALYLHYPNRAELLVAAARHLDVLHDMEGRLADSRAAASGRTRLALWVEAWGGYIPLMYGTGKAIMAMVDSDEAARAAWEDRMEAVRHGAAAAVRDLARDGDLAPWLSEDEATDLLFNLQSVRGWEQLVIEFGWPQDRYIEVIKESAARLLIA